MTDRAVLRPVRVGVEIASALSTLFPGQAKLDSATRLFGSADGLARIKAGDDPSAVAATWGPPPKPPGGELVPCIDCTEIGCTDLGTPVSWRDRGLRGDDARKSSASSARIAYCR